MPHEYVQYTYRRLEQLSHQQIASLLPRIEDVCRVFGLIYKANSLEEIAEMLSDIKRINSNEYALILESLYSGYRFVIVWKGKRYGVYTDLPRSLHLPIALMDENNELVAHVIVKDWDDSLYMPETVVKYTGPLRQSWFIHAISVPEGYVHNWLKSYCIYRLIKFEWGGQSCYIPNLTTAEEAFRPICLPGMPKIFLRAGNVYNSHPRQLNELQPFDWRGETCNFAVYNREVRL